MIIYGWRTFTKDAETGSFQCPVCRTQRTFQHHISNRWVTLYFIPVIPLGRAGEYISCQSCGSTFGMEAIYEQPAAPDPNDVLADLQLVLSLLLLAMNRITPSDVLAVQAMLRNQYDYHVVPGKIRQDIEQAHGAGADLASFASQRLGGLSVDIRQSILNAIHQFAAEQGWTLDSDAQALRQLDAGLGLPSPFRR